MCSVIKPLGLVTESHQGILCRPLNKSLFSDGLTRVVSFVLEPFCKCQKEGRDCTVCTSLICGQS